VPLVLPCHRVVRSDGTVGQYLGGAEVKVALLEMESARVRR
jgi:methylated-DNA-[protein]-cysteine S-methyltransferase